jgi:hypothetical protein
MRSRSDETSYAREQRSLVVALVAAGGVLAIVWAVCIVVFGFWLGLVTGWVPAFACALLVFYVAQATWLTFGVGLATVLGVITLLLAR